MYSNVEPRVVIYKHDLLSAFKDYRLEINTVCRFMMTTFRIPDFYKYKALESQINSSLSLSQFLLMFVRLLRCANLPLNEGGPKNYIIIDEYTIIPKIFLIIVIIVAKKLNIGVLVCGDRDQLQTIRDSKHTRSQTSFDTISQLADDIFYLDTNERCSNPTYNEFIRLLSQYSTDRSIDLFAQALIYAMLPTKINSTAQFTDLHLSATHQELARLQHKFVCEEKLPVSFYYIHLNDEALRTYYTRAAEEGTAIELVGGVGEGANLQPEGARRVMRRLECGLFEPILLRDYLESGNIPGKFLPYLTLKIGSLYYHEDHSEQCIVRLLEIHAQDEPENNYGAEYLVVENLSHNATCDSQKFIVTKCFNEKVMFKPHYDHLLGRDDSGSDVLPIPNPSVYNYPLYPINFITNHKVQGCTVLSNIDVNLEKVNYRGMYVSLSRVRDPQQISNITFSSGTNISMFITTIINVPELCDINFHDPTSLLPVSVLRERIIDQNYQIYQTNDYSHEMLSSLSEFFNTTDTARKHEIRNWMINRMLYPQQYKVDTSLLSKPAVVDANYALDAYEKSESILTCIINNQELLWSVAKLSLEASDLACMIKALIDTSPDFLSCASGSANASGRNTAGLFIDRFCGTDNACPMNETLLAFILRNAKRDCYAIYNQALQQQQQHERFIRLVDENDPSVCLVAKTKLQKVLYDMIKEQELTFENMLRLIEQVKHDSSFMSTDEPGEQDAIFIKKKSEPVSIENFTINKRQRRH